MTGFISLETVQLSIGENDGTVLVPIMRTGDLSGAVAVEYGVTGGTATADADFVAATGTITIPVGADRVLLPVEINDDDLSEATETFTVSLINVDSGALQAPRTTLVDILDDENPVTDPPVPPLESDFEVSQDILVSGLSQPIAMEFAPQNDSLIYIAQKGGLIRVYDTGTDSFVGDFVDLTDKVNNIQDRGLMDIALHPNFPDDPYVYAFYVVDPPESAGQTGNAGPDGGGNRYAHVVKMTADAATGFTTIVPGSEEIIIGGAGQSAADISGGGAIDSTSDLTLAPSDYYDNGEAIQDYIKVDSRSHAGGSLEFGPDGALYVSIGDGTSFNAVDPRTLSVQDINSLSGKILRVDPLTGEGLSDNPFVQPDDDLDTNSSKVYQLGLRNPFSMSFDQEGKLIITDTGWSSWEEINVGGPGANFGWPFFEGGDNGQQLRTNGYRNLAEAQEFYDAVDDGSIELTAAFRAFAHANGEPGFQFNSIVGADDTISSEVYPDVLQDDYIFVDFSQGQVFSVDSNDRRDVKFLYKTDNGLGPVHFKQGPDGYIYAVDVVTGQINRLNITDPNATAPRAGEALTVDYFDMDASLSELADVDFAAAPTFTETVTEINQSTSGAFYANGPTDQFAARYSGTIDLAVGGDYTFYLNSDDGSRLLINGTEIISNDGLHSAILKTATIDLAAGSHDIVVEYFENEIAAVLDLDWSGPGFPRQQMRFSEAQDPDPVENLVSNDPTQIQFLVGTAERDVFVIDDSAAEYGWGPTEDGNGYVVWTGNTFNVLEEFELIRFNDVEVDTINGTVTPIPGTNPGENLVADNPDETQFLLGFTANDVFIIDGSSTEYQWGPTEDGNGTVVWKGTSFDILQGFETLRFNNADIDLANGSVTPRPGSNIINDEPGVTQYVEGTVGDDIFAIDGESSNYGWGLTEDGLGIVVWTGTDFDLLYEVEELQFNDQTVDLEALLDA